MPEPAGRETSVHVTESVVGVTGAVVPGGATVAGSIVEGIGVTGKVPHANIKIPRAKRKAINFFMA